MAFTKHISQSGLGLIYGLMGLGLSACTTTGTASQNTKPSNQAIGEAKAALSARTLAPGECGLFIWFETGSQFAVFSQNGTGAKLASPNGEISLVPLADSTKTGPSPAPDNYNQYPVQDFVDESGNKYYLKLAQAQNVANGIRYKAGIWRSTGADGWDIVKSAIGYSTCITQDSNQNTG